MEKQHKRSGRNFIMAVIAIIEVVALVIVGTYAWIEGSRNPGVSGSNLSIANSSGIMIKINNSYEDTVSLNNFLDASGLFVLSEVSSVDAETFFVRDVSAAGTGVLALRAGTLADKNVKYIDYEFDIVADIEETNVWFDMEKTYLKLLNTTSEDCPIRVGLKFGDEPDFKIFSTRSDNATQAVTKVDSLGNPIEFETQVVYAFSSFADNDHPLFHLEVGEQVTVTMRVWLEGANANCVDRIAGTTFDLSLYFASKFESIR